LHNRSVSPYKHEKFFVHFVANFMTSSGISISIIELRFRHLPQFHIAFIGRQTPNGLRYLRVGGRGQCLGAGKTQSQKNA
jgi:hypothetical protein